MLALGKHTNDARIRVDGQWKEHTAVTMVYLLEDAVLFRAPQGWWLSHRDHPEPRFLDEGRCPRATVRPDKKAVLCWGCGGTLPLSIPSFSGECPMSLYVSELSSRGEPGWERVGKKPEGMDSCGFRFEAHFAQTLAPLLQLDCPNKSNARWNQAVSIQQYALLDQGLVPYPEEFEQLSAPPPVY
jgi:hypothetical protein